MKNMNIFVIICCIILPVFSFNEVTPKFCVNCKFFINNCINNIYGKCSLFPMETNIDYFVTGDDKLIDFNYCSVARNRDDMCGKEGKKYINKLSTMDVLNEKRCNK